MTAVVANSSYYIRGHGEDVDGNLLRRVPIEPPPFDDMVDPNFVGKARPTRVVVGYCPKRGRCAYFYDRHGNTIFVKRYTGLTALLLGCSHGEVDVDWMRENQVPIVDHSQATMCSLV